jgi:hypothetical protein
MWDTDIPHREETKKMSYSVPDPALNSKKAFPSRTKSHIPWKKQSVPSQKEAALKIYTDNVS